MSNSPLPPAFAGILIFVIIFGVLIGLAVNALICWLLMGCLNRVPPQYRKMEPGMVWLLMIPCFHLVWNFFVFLRVPESYQAYFTATGKSDGSDYGRTLGLVFAICSACCIIPFLNYLAGPAALILLIIVLVKLTGYKKLVADVPAAAAPAVPPPPPVA